MRVLHLTPELPRWPGGTGGATRQFHLLRRLAERGHEVRVVAPVSEEAAGAGERLAQAGITLTGVPRPPSRALESLGALTRRPALVPAALTQPMLAWQVGVFWAGMRPEARRLCAEWRPEVVTIEHDSAAAWIGDLPGTVPAALVLQNVGPHYYESRARAAGGVAGALLRAEAGRFRRLHARWLDRYRLLVAVSERDREDLRAVTGVPVEVVPNGVASDELRPSGVAEDEATVLFTGTLGHPPNAEGITWFADRVWPAVRAGAPDARLLVVGRAPTREVLALDGRDGIEVVGPVPEMGPFFALASAVVAPLLSGGGTRLKILEAMACGRPVVSTSVGCEGLELEDGRELLIEDDPGRFAEATLRLLAEPELRQRLAREGRDVAERTYDWRVLGDRLAAALERMRGLDG